MGIKLVTFAAQTVTPQDDALIYETALQESGMIYGGAVTIKNANVLHVDAGHGALCGRKFTIEATDVPVPLTASGSLQGRIYIHMDLSDTGEPISFQVETASSLTPVIQQADVNINSGIYEINLATFIVDTSTISNLVNVAPFIDIEPDSGFNAQSNNPVQNKVITKAVGVPETIGGLASQEYNVGDSLLGTDGQFYDVIAHINPNTTISLNGNVTKNVNGNVVERINSLSSQISNFANRIDAKTLGTGVNIISYTTYANAYTAPSDGYVRVFCYPADYAFINCLFNNVTLMRAIGISNQQGMYISCFVRKGTKIHFTRDGLVVAHRAEFIPLV